MRIAQGCIYIIRNMFLISLLLFLLGIIADFLLIYLPALVLFLLGLVFLLFTVLLLLFFRDPDREIGEDIVAPADGKIVKIKETNDKDVGKCYFVSTFMNIFDTHVNRCPLDGKIIKTLYKPGGHLPAFTKNYESNESNIILLQTEIGLIKIVQVAGVFARRIVCYVKEGDDVKKGERIGIIKFGSRVDLYLPKNSVKIFKKMGSRVKAGVDTIAKVNG